jgi:membrane associated rhomboid family serine protease
MRAFLPVIVLVWGAAILINGLINGPSGGGSYASGQLFAMVVGAVMVFLASRQLFSRGR